MRKVLVAGATGYLGRYLVEELHYRGYKVRAIASDRNRAEKSGAWEAPDLKGLVDNWILSTTNISLLIICRLGKSKTNFVILLNSK